MAVAAEPTWHLEPAPKSLRRAPGRKALRAAAATVGLSLGDCVANERGAASLPAGVIGSIAHTPGVSIAVICTSPMVAGIGIDIEPTQPARLRIEGRVLTSAESESLASLDEEARWRAVLTVFCAKEAGYKALDAHVLVPLTFHAVEVDPCGLSEVGHLRVLEPDNHLETRVATAQDRQFTAALAVALRSNLMGVSFRL